MGVDEFDELVAGGGAEAVAVDVALGAGGDGVEDFGDEGVGVFDGGLFLLLGEFGGFVGVFGLDGARGERGEGEEGRDEAGGEEVEGHGEARRLWAKNAEIVRCGRSFGVMLRVAVYKLRTMCL